MYRSSQKRRKILSTLFHERPGGNMQISLMPCKTIPSFVHFPSFSIIFLIISPCWGRLIELGLVSARKPMRLSSRMRMWLYSAENFLAPRNSRRIGVSLAVRQMGNNGETILAFYLSTHCRPALFWGESFIYLHIVVLFHCHGLALLPKKYHLLSQIFNIERWSFEAEYFLLLDSW